MRTAIRPRAFSGPERCITSLAPATDAKRSSAQGIGHSRGKSILSGSPPIPGQDGVVLAEMLDRDNNVLKGLSRHECIPFTGDAVAHTLPWRTKAFTPGQRDGDKKFRFVLRSAGLYSYRSAL